MDEYIKSRAEAAKWIAANKNNPVWWTSGVLTSQNTAPNSLNLPNPLATQIWTDLVHKNFFIEAPCKVNGHAVYTFNPGREKEWHDVMYPPNAFVKLWRHFAKDILTLIISAITAYVTIILNNNFGNDSFKTESLKRDKQITELSSSIESLRQTNSTIKDEIVSIKTERNFKIKSKK